MLNSCDSDSTSNNNNYTGQIVNVDFNVDGFQRRCLVYLPYNYQNFSNLSMIFVIHGGGGSPTGFLDIANFRNIADREKVILVYPEGINQNWNDGRPTQPNIMGINDVEFFNIMCNYMINNYNVNSRKIYATGLSNGGFMASRLGCELNNKIAAIAVVAATMEENTIFPNCNPINTVPALYIHGTQDPIVPFTGGTMTAGAGGEILSHIEVINKWVSINNCNVTPVLTDLPNIANDGTTIKLESYLNGSNGSEVLSYIVLNGGHTWPQGPQYLSESIVGKVSQDMNACETIWSFFRRFER